MLLMIWLVCVCWVKQNGSHLYNKWFNTQNNKGEVAAKLLGYRSTDWKVIT